MPHPVHIVVRKSKTTGKHFCGAASTLPLSHYERVASLGYWYGSQMSYRPYQDAVAAGWEMASDLDGQDK